MKERTLATADSVADMVNRFQYHAPTGQDQRDAHETVRRDCLQLAGEFDKSLPPGREKSLAITKLEEAMFWANAAIARNREATP